MRVNFATIYDEQVRNVYGFFAYRINSRTEAEDLTQVTFERALKAWPRYDPRRAAPGTWLLAIARNILTDHYRADRSGSHRSLDDTASGAEAKLPSVDDVHRSDGLAPELTDALRPTEIAKEPRAIRTLLGQACEEYWVVRLAYVDGKGRTADLTVEPTDLDARKLYAHCFPRGNERIFVVDRIEWARVLTEAEEELLP